jgi:hypothetical protein
MTRALEWLWASRTIAEDDPCRLLVDIGSRALPVIDLSITPLVDVGPRPPGQGGWNTAAHPRAAARLGLAPVTGEIRGQPPAPAPAPVPMLVPPILNMGPIITQPTVAVLLTVTRNPLPPTDQPIPLPPVVISPDTGARVDPPPRAVNTMRIPFWPQTEDRDAPLPEYVTLVFPGLN